MNSEVSNPQHSSPMFRLVARQRYGRILIRATGRLLYRFFARVSIIGKEWIPRSGGYIIAINHTSVFEPPVILVHWPVHVTPLGAIDVWNEKEKATLAWMYGGIPIDRDQYDRAAVEKVIATLNQSQPVLIAPEGRLTFKPGMRRAKWGIAYILQQARVPVIPVVITGAGPAFLQKVLQLRRPVVDIKIGRPFLVPDLSAWKLERRLAYQKNADLVLAHVAEVLPENYRGFYANYENYLACVPEE